VKKNKGGASFRLLRFCYAAHVAACFRLKITFNNGSVTIIVTSTTTTRTANKAGDNSFVSNPIPAMISAASTRETILAPTAKELFQKKQPDLPQRGTDHFR
jgi:hypothetical protein